MSTFDEPTEIEKLPTAQEPQTSYREPFRAGERYVTGNHR